MGFQVIIDDAVEGRIFCSCQDCFSALNAIAFFILDELSQAASTKSMVAWLDINRAVHNLKAKRASYLVLDGLTKSIIFCFLLFLLFLFLTLLCLLLFCLFLIIFILFFFDLFTSHNLQSESKSFCWLDSRSGQQPDLCLILNLFLNILAHLGILDVCSICAQISQEHSVIFFL